MLAARQAPAYAPGTSLHFLLWKNFSPPADVEIVRQATEWGKQNKVTVKVEQIDANDIPARAAAAIESKQGPDILQFFQNWQNQYAESLVDVTDLCTALESRYGPYFGLREGRRAAERAVHGGAAHRLLEPLRRAQVVPEGGGHDPLAEDVGRAAPRRQEVEGGGSPDRPDARPYVR
jgi:hypothetical protein